MKTRSRSFVKSLRSHKKTILLIAITAVFTLIANSMISMLLSRTSDVEIPSIGTIKFEGVEGYWDENLTNKTGTNVPYNWGLIWPGATRNLTLYLRSISNVDTEFKRTETDWTFYNSSTPTPDKIVTGPSNATSYMSLTWDYDNSTVHPGQVVQVTMTLHVGSSPAFIDFLIEKGVEAFSFDTNISTIEYS